jgi:tetratricopeptide (TPR) repeat protein
VASASLDPIYKKRARAYAQFKKLPEGTEPKWQAFLNFLAAYFDAKGGAWTASDTRAALEEANVDSQIIAKIEAIHISKDKTVFSQNEEATEISELNATARRVRVAFAKTALTLMVLLSLLPNETVAASWSEAESAFASALATPVGSRQASAFYTKSALLFEAVAQTSDDAASAFYNAGNAWFQANKLGRAITAYRNAARIRPFDEALLDNLAVRPSAERSIRSQMADPF